MKKSKLTFFIISSIIFLFAVLLLLKKVATGGFEKELIPSFTEPQSHWIDIHGPYIKTSWKQDSAYAAFTPDNELLGCWSVVFAQVLAIKLVRNGHAVVFDGTAEENNDLYVHVNFGWGGKSDGWFDIKSLANQRELLYIFTVIPL
jgi:hypothetical protein